MESDDSDMDEELLARPQKPVAVSARMLSKAGADQEKPCGVCFIPLAYEAGSLRLKCGCTIHFHCLLPWIHAKLGDR
jgi:hypothetical protein